VSEYREILESVIQERPDLVKVLGEVAETRERAMRGSVDDDPATLHEILVHNRGLIERLQTLTTALAMRRHMAVQKMKDAQARRDDAYMHSATAKTVGFSDYASAAEKDAHYSLGALDEIMALRKAESLFRDVDAAYEFARSTLRGMEGSHRDLEVRIRLISLTGVLGG